MQKGNNEKISPTAGLNGPQTPTSSPARRSSNQTPRQISSRPRSSIGLPTTPLRLNQVVRKENSPLLSNSHGPFNSPMRSPYLKNFSAKLPGSANVKVVVRVRPFLPREIEKGASNLIVMDSANNSTTILPPPPLSPSSLSQTNSRSRRNYESKTFTFDHSFYSADPESKDFATQDIIYEKVGKEFLDHNMEGYHTCIFAYGQTGSGKSYTMMGTEETPGLIPRTCQDLFKRIKAVTSADTQCTVRVSYFEVYNEQVRDLLVPPAKDGSHQRLRVRESPTEGPYVENLSEFAVQSVMEVDKYMEMGNKNRAVASTKMNDQSSRSHAVFTLVVKQVISDPVTDSTEEKTARIRLVDLAGSERALATGATGQRLREGSNINKSLTTLGRVIAALAIDSTKDDSNRPETVVPYRDSVLTWILKESLGGNSKTAMVACISPTDYEETLSTLRYADQAKSIRTRAVVNHDIVSAADRDKLLAEMQERINSLQLSLMESTAAAAAAANSINNEDLAKQKESDRNNYLEKVKGVIRFYEDKAITEETKRRAIQSENEAVKRHNRLLIEHLKEVTNKTLGNQFVFADDEEKAECIDEGNNDKPHVSSLDFGNLQKTPKRLSFLRPQVTYEELENEINDILKDLKSFKSNLIIDINTYQKKPHLIST
ncbi:uncharacterized protein SAPINGB_P003737 [Magnusiomyces paraingens]|uniref:Kinesin-like protein n=1 Tax=Magnusiomyces paraingens TaxID=2606893 RepID=A0A5E8BQZ4_9ASCO|nr:uncharacterized protein SAPINGB_P003737 [Saprochaete ingens]VVT53763.1 unnamed protein product [Saprochaete ingens]